MKRVTVAITFTDSYYSYTALKRVRAAMINAAVERANIEMMEISLVEAKTGYVQPRKTR